jgi:hypothetical protein
MVCLRFMLESTVGGEAELAQKMASFRALCSWLDCLCREAKSTHVSGGQPMQYFNIE